jgi:dipeptidyl aminopeptidase/acylaminoacyl peptidase
MKKRNQSTQSQLGKSNSAWCCLSLGPILSRRLLVGAALIALIGSSHTETVSARRLLEVVDLGNPVVSPDGQHVAFRSEQASIERNVYDTVWYVQRMDGTAPPHRVGEGGIPLRQYVNGIVMPAPATWSPDGRWIYYRAEIDGKLAVWRAAADGSGARPVTHDPADVREFSLSTDGGTVTYSVGATREEVIDSEQAEYDRGIRIDASTFIGAGLFRSSELEGKLATQRFVGDWFTTGPMMANVPDTWKKLDMSSGATREVPSSERPVATLTNVDISNKLPVPWKVVVNPLDGRTATLTRVGEAAGLAEKPGMELAMLPNRDAVKAVKCSGEACTKKRITDVQWRPHSDEILFTVTDRHEGHAQSIWGWNVATDVVRPVAKGRGLLRGSSQRTWDIPCGVSVDVLVCVAADADRPPRLERIDLTTGERRVLFDPNAALASDIAATTPAKLLRWKDAKGREFTGQLFEARSRNGRTRHPLFVTYYTCEGFLRGGLGDEWPLTTLAEHGISALCINGLPGQRLDVAEYYGQGMLAVESVVDLLSEEGRIDRGKVGMGGLSYGGEVTTWTAMHSGVLTASSVASPSITPTWYLFNSLRDSFRASIKKYWQLGAPTETPAQWRLMSPAFNIDKFRAPVLFQMAEQEYLLALDYALPLLRAHRADIYVFPNEPHIKFQPKHKLAVYQRNLDWFRFWLQNYEDPDPAKSGQYNLWRSMRESATQRSDEAGHKRLH